MTKTIQRAAIKKAYKLIKEKGTKIEQGKAAAGRVLTGKGGQFSQTTGNYDLNDTTQRRQAGIDLINKLRGG